MDVKARRLPVVNQATGRVGFCQLWCIKLYLMLTSLFT